MKKIINLYWIKYLQVTLEYEKHLEAYIQKLRLELGQEPKEVKWKLIGLRKEAE